MDNNVSQNYCLIHLMNIIEKIPNKMPINLIYKYVENSVHDQLLFISSMQGQLKHVQVNKHNIFRQWRKNPKNTSKRNQKKNTWQVQCLFMIKLSRKCVYGMNISPHTKGSWLHTHILDEGSSPLKSALE